MVLLRAGIWVGSRQSIKKGPFYSVGIFVVPALKEDGVGGDGGPTVVSGHNWAIFRCVSHLLQRKITSVSQ